jgi:hypothetical protein
MLVWKVWRYNINANKIEEYNVLNYKESLIKKLKKQCMNREEFSEKLKGQMRYQYWARSEHELIIELKGNRVVLSPWCGRSDAMCLEVFLDSSFDWLGFAKQHIEKQIYSNKAKIDIYDQLAWRWDEFVDYCWYTRLPYERKHQKFEK